MAQTMTPLTSSPLSLSDSDFNNGLTYQIYSLLESKFLFGNDSPKQLSECHPLENLISATTDVAGKVRILSIDSSASTDGILAAKSLSLLQSSLRAKSNNRNAQIADYFDVVAGSGIGGVLAALLFTRGRNGCPIFSAEDSLNFLIQNRRSLLKSSGKGLFGRFSRSSKKAEKIIRQVFGEMTIKDTVKSVLIPCYDLKTRAPFVFSRADAVETDGYDFKMSDVCIATLACPVRNGPVHMVSVDKRTEILAVGGEVAMSNPTATAITHVLNNKQEFPFCNSVDDLLVVSLGNGESHFGGTRDDSNPMSPTAFIKIAGGGASDMVDQAVSITFGQHRTDNYVRIQGYGIEAQKSRMEKDIIGMADMMLGEKSVESVLFGGKKLSGITNYGKLEKFGEELIKEEERRKTSILPNVVLKAATPSPRTSSATTLSLSTASSY
ncbi:Patatin-like phospholipase domain [Dillenia turbinata]|uniref:Patatin n=1 Tax=Dillenia turbinata TaxID=194707 RepID=A0AAN8UKD0_9MAGN